MRRARTVVVGVAVGLVLVTGAGVALSATGTLDLPTPWGSDTDPLDDPTPAPSTDDPRDVPPPPDLALPDPGADRPVLAPPRGPAVDPAAVRDRLGALLRDPDLGRHRGVFVRDLGRDRAVTTLGDPDPYVPASTLKLVTSAAVLAELGPDHRFRTRVVRVDPPRTRGVAAAEARAVLVGGGDPLLTTRPEDSPAPDLVTASIVELAGQTARALRQSGVRRVRVGVDAGLFTGPAESPAWEPDYVPDDVVSPISALWVDEGRVVPGGLERSADPAAAAGEAFAGALRRRGLTVVGTPTTEDAPTVSGGPRLLAEAAGAPLDQVVSYVLEVSDNEASEVLLRHVALASGRPASFAAGARAARDVLTELGVPWAGVRMFDGSGLSRDNRVTQAALAQVLQLGADPERPDLRTVTGGLPVAGFTGSLESRFLDADAAAGRGLVRAKTGTLSRVNGLAGTVVTRDGTLLGFGLLTDRVRPVDTLDARAQLDEMAAALARCGCTR